MVFLLSLQEKMTGNKWSGSAGTIGFSWKSCSEVMTNWLDTLGWKAKLGRNHWPQSQRRGSGRQLETEKKVQASVSFTLSAWWQGFLGWSLVQETIRLVIGKPCSLTQSFENVKSIRWGQSRRAAFVCFFILKVWGSFKKMAEPAEDTNGCDILDVFDSPSLC